MEETEKKEDTAEKNDTEQQLPTITLTYFALFNLIVLSVGAVAVSAAIGLFLAVKVHEWWNWKING